MKCKIISLRGYGIPRDVPVLLVSSDYQTKQLKINYQLPADKLTLFDFLRTGTAGSAELSAILKKPSTNVLILEDDSTLKFIYEELLIEGKYSFPLRGKNLLIAVDPQEAKELLKKQPEFIPDLVITDLYMSTMNEDIFIKEIRNGAFWFDESP